MNFRDGVSSNRFDGDEVVAYMMPRILEAPLPSEWVNIYTWCGLQFAKTFEKTGANSGHGGGSTPTIV